MNLEEFLEPRQKDEAGSDENEKGKEVIVEETPSSVELDVQKAVVESLAADKAEQDEHLCQMKKENDSLKSELSTLKETVRQLKEELAKTGDLLSANAETTDSNKVSLLDRELELSDRFPGETRDHVLETLRAGRDQAEKDGCLRKAQILESVLVANEPAGTLVEKRNELAKLFSENSNILSGPVIEGLDKLGISYKKGENYLLPSEIIKRNY